MRFDCISKILNHCPFVYYLLGSSDSCVHMAKVCFDDATACNIIIAKLLSFKN